MNEVTYQNAQLARYIFTAMPGDRQKVLPQSIGLIAVLALEAGSSGL